MPEVKFQVGQVYANRDGEYEVLSIDPSGGRMEVQFVANRSTKSLDMTIQSRIVQNMQLEARMAENARLAEKLESEKPEKAPRAPRAPRAATGEKKAPGEKKALGREFQGMRPEDFTGSVLGTTWRSKDSLAGGVRARLQRHFKKPFKSSPVYNWPVVYLSHQDVAAKAEEGVRVARFMLRADEQGLHHGLYLERASDLCVDFDRFVRRLGEDDTLRQFASQLEKGDLRLEGRRRTASGVEPLWEADSPWETRLEALTAPCGEGETREISLIRVMPVQEAVDKGADLVDEIGAALVQLAPFYNAAAL